ncbi:MAG: methylenetetrahydrofolate reductase [NAD(P)H] [Desulfobulbaceae bacterium]|nr:methylenetetrahydrofolate reductase [NAD(P)H] [Desulfobulbaceae bacterium]
MLVKDILAASRPSCSFEFFPPKTDALRDDLDSAIVQLLPLKPSYVSVTYGAGGSNRDRTFDLTVRIRKKTGLPVISHLTCVGSNREEIRDLLARYEDNDIRDILALRGDPPRDQATAPAADDFKQATDLVAFIKKEFPAMGVGVAGFPEGHPETPNRLKEIDFLKEKVDAGADYIVTQLFFDNRDFYDFCQRCELAGIRVPIVAGILPITTRTGMIRMADLAAGARVPAPLLRAVARCTDDADIERVGIHWATEQVRDLVDHRVSGIHLYTLNNATATRQIFHTLGVKDSAQLRG